MSSVVGIDIAKASFVAHLVAAAGRATETFANSPAGFAKLLAWIAKRDPSPVNACMEATSTYHLALATALYDAGHTVFVINPWRTKQHARSEMQRTKTDQVDARLLADFCLEKRLYPWRPQSPAMRALVELVRLRQAIIEQTVAARNRRGALTTPEALAASAREVQALNQEVRRVTDDIRKHVANHPELAEQCELLKSIPGIADVAAPLLLAELGDRERFANVRQVIAYAGLCPTDRQSAERRPPARLTMLGNRHLRRALFMPAIVNLRTRRFAPELTERMLLEKRHKMTILAALMHRLLATAYGVLKSGVPYDPNYNVRDRTRDRAA